MVQDQLVEYISTQLKLGVSRDAIKSALAGVGWASVDVEDTLKKVEAPSVSPAAAAQAQIAQKTSDAMASTASSPKVVSFSTPGTVVASTKNPEPQTIRVSDLVSAAAPSSSMSSPVIAPKIISGTMDAGKASKGPFQRGSLPISAAASGGKKKSSGLILGILAVILIVVLGAFAGYLFVKNDGLNSELLAAQSGQQGAAQSAALQAQLQALDASSTVLSGQVASLTAANQDLMTNLSFLMAPANLSSSETSSPVTVSGVLSAGLGKDTYIITTTYGIKVSVKNSSVAAVAAMLQPLLGTTVQISGTYAPGTPSVIIGIVNGLPVSPPSLATTTPAAATTTP